MKKYWKLIAGVAAFVIFMAVVGVAYKSLSEGNKPGQNLVIREGTDAGEDGVTGSGTNSGTGMDTEAGEGTDAEMETTDGTDSADDTKDEGTDLQLAPNFTVENAEGEEVSLHDFFGKPIVMNFWASWCGPCKMEMPDFQEAYEKYGDEITFLMVNMTDGVQETKKSATEHIEKAGYTLPIYFDTKQDAAYTYSVYSLPTTFFLNEKGEAVAYAQGMIDAQTLQTGIDMIYSEASENE